MHAYVNVAASGCESGFALVVGNGHGVPDMSQGGLAVRILSPSPDDEAEIEPENETDFEVAVEIEFEDGNWVLPKIPV